MASLIDGFNTKEVIKVKILDNCMEDVDNIKSKLNNPSIGLTFIQKVGHVITLYKPFEK